MNEDAAIAKMWELLERTDRNEDEQRVLEALLATPVTVPLAGKVPMGQITLEQWGLMRTPLQADLDQLAAELSELESLEQHLLEDEQGTTDAT